METPSESKETLELLGLLPQCRCSNGLAEQAGLGIKKIITVKQGKGKQGKLVLNRHGKVAAIAYSRLSSKTNEEKEWPCTPTFYMPEASAK